MTDSQTVPRRRNVFRRESVLAYGRTDVVPRLVYWPAIACAWLCLVALIGSAGFAWSARVPVVVEGTGILVVDQAVLMGVVFLPAEAADQVRVGQHASLRIGSSELQVQGMLSEVSAGPLSPEAARKTYGLDGAAALLITGPATVATVSLTTPLPASTYAGSVVEASLEVGSQRLVALIPGVRDLLGERP